MVGHRDRCLAVLFRYVQLRIGCLRSPRLRYAFRSTVAERFPFFPRAAARSDVNSRRFGDGFAKVLVTALELSLAMKLRLLDDSIRLRLSRSEVAASHERGTATGQTRFPDGSVFCYVLRSVPRGAFNVRYLDHQVVVEVPASQIAQWATDDEAVSLRGQVALRDGGLLKLLVEKDFTCLSHRHDEDQSDLFPNPEANR